jgi:hypothetical protein
VSGVSSRVSSLQDYDDNPMPVPYYLSKSV